MALVRSDPEVPMDKLKLATNRPDLHPAKAMVTILLQTNKQCHRAGLLPVPHAWLLSGLWLIDCF